MLPRVFCLLVVLLFACACRASSQLEAAEREEVAMEMELVSTAFENEEMIPSRYTSDGLNHSPPLSWSGLPEGTVTMALICDDPDAPIGTFVHWVLYDLPASVTELPEGLPPDKVLDNGAKQGTNGFLKIGYRGPSPPSGTHRYYFKLYALDCELGLKPGATKKQLLQATEGHILAQAQLMGRYKRR